MTKGSPGSTVPCSPLPCPSLHVSRATRSAAACSWALACDLRICRAGVKVGLPVSRIGLMLSPLEHKMLVDQIGPSRAKWLLLTGRRLQAMEAAAWRLIDTVADDDAFDAAVDALTADIASGAPLALAAAKNSLWPRRSAFPMTW